MIANQLNNCGKDITYDYEYINECLGACAVDCRYKGPIEICL